MRAREHNVVNENMGLKDHIGLLKDILESNRIPIPEALVTQGTESAYVSGQQSRSDTDISAGDLTIDLTEMQTVEAERWCSEQAAETDPRPYEAPTIDPSVETSASELQESPRPQSLDSQAGIDFVLA